MDANTENKVEKLPKTRKITQQPKMKIVLALLLLLIISGGIYVWQKQNSRIKNLNTQLSDLKNTTKTQDDKILSQTNKIADLEKQIAATQPTPQSVQVQADKPDVKMTVKSATRIDTLYGGKNYVAITVSLTNSGSASTTLSMSSFKLTDANNNKYPSVREQQSSESDYNYVISILNLPKNNTLLTAQTVNKGETVSGTLVFYAANSISNFNLSYNDSTYQVSLN